MFPSLRLVTWFESLLRLRKLIHATCSCFHSLKAVISPSAQRNAFPVYVKAIHTALPRSFESVFWYSNTAFILGEQFALPLYCLQVCSCIVLLCWSRKELESSWNWKAIGFQLRLYFFLAHCALQVNPCGILLERKKENAVVSRLGKI